MSNNLGLDQVAENQANKEVTINTATGQIDAAITERISLDVTAGNVSVSNAQYRGAIVLDITGAATSGRTVTLPSIKRMLVVTTDPTNTDTVDLVKGTTVYTMGPGATVIIYTDGTANGLAILFESSTGAARPYDVGTFCVGTPVASEKLLAFNYVRNVSWASGLVGSRVTAAVAATAQTDFVVAKNGSAIGTIRFAAAGTIATFIGFTAPTWAPNDILTLTAPGTPDATLADISFTFAGTQV